MCVYVCVSVMCLDCNVFGTYVVYLQGLCRLGGNVLGIDAAGENIRVAQVDYIYIYIYIYIYHRN
jgi:hypothetical protein